MSGFDSDDEGLFEDQPNQTYEAQLLYKGQKNIKPSQPYDESVDKLKQFQKMYMEQLNQFDNRLLFAQQMQETVKLSSIYYEDDLGVFDFFKSGVQLYDKIASAFVVLEDEAKRIIDICIPTLFNTMQIYGEHANSQDDKKSNVVLEFSRLLPTLKDAYERMKRLNEIVNNAVNQLHIISFKKSELHKDLFKVHHLFSVFSTIGKLLGIAHLIDQVIEDNPKINDDWSQYKTMLQIVRTEKEKYNVTPEQIQNLERQLARVDRTILAGKCFSTIVQQNFDKKSNEIIKNSKNQLPPIQKNDELKNLFESYFKYTYKQLAGVLGTSQEIREKEKLYELICVMSLFQSIFKCEVNRKLWKLIWALQKKTPVIVIQNNVTIYVGQFIQQNCYLMKKSLLMDPKEWHQNIFSCIKAIDGSFKQQMLSFQSQFCKWAIKIESDITHNETIQYNTIKKIDERVKLIIKGIALSSQIKQLITSEIFIHYKESTEINPALIAYLFMGISLLKGIEFLFKKYEESFPSQILYRYIGCQLKEALDPLLSKYHSNNSKANSQTFIEKSLKFIQKALKGPYSELRYSIIGYCFNYLRKKDLIKEQQLNDFEYLVEKLYLIANYKHLISEYCNCAFFYWLKDFYPYFYKHIFENPNEAKRMKFFLQSLNDQYKMLLYQKHMEGPLDLNDAFTKQSLGEFQEHFIINLAKEVEDYLRQKLHAILVSTNDQNPIVTKVKDLSKLLIGEPIEFLDKMINIKDNIAKYLNWTFYNMNAINIHDQLTYDQMRALAQSKFDLQLIPGYIPRQTITQGIVDILNILRNIRDFITRYNYNIYNQTFIEIVQDSKFLNTIGIPQISDSISTHGIGIVNTTINALYKYIQKKFVIFSKFLYDDLISQPLKREQKNYQRKKEDWGGRYPFAQAEKIAKEIKKLGSYSQEDSYLDKFREVITQIGNALGLVRLIRTASLNYCSKNIEYAPFFEEDISYQELAQQANLSETSQQQGQNLDQLFSIFKYNFSESTDYLKLFSQSFQGQLENDSLSHLKLFYQLIPSVVINHIDSLTISREKLQKPNAQRAFITDDGFPLGIAYFLKLLDQEEQYESLNWQQEYNEHQKKLVSNIDKILQDKYLSTQKRRKEDMEIQQEMSRKRLEIQKEQTQLYFYAFRSAQLLFRDEVQ